MARTRLAVPRCLQAKMVMAVRPKGISLLVGTAVRALVSSFKRLPRMRAVSAQVVALAALTSARRMLVPTNRFEVMPLSYCQYHPLAHPRRVARLFVKRMLASRAGAFVWTTTSSSALSAACLITHLHHTAFSRLKL